MTGNKKIANPNIQAVYGLTPMQEGMLYTKMLDETSSEYVIQVAMKLKEPMKRELVKGAVTLLLERFDVLRTMIFYRKTDKPKQIVLKKRVKFFRYVDLKEKEIALETYLKQDVSRGFDLEKDTLIRVSMLVTPDQEQILVWTMHHIIMDGWCTGILFQKFFDYYNKLSNGMTKEEIQREIKVEQVKETSYEEYIEWLSRQNQGKAKEYFGKLLDGYDNSVGIEPLCKVKDHAKQAAEVHIDGNENLARSLEELSRRKNITISSILETAWGILLQNYNHVEDAVFGKVVSGRNVNLPGIEHTLGLFVNTIPVRIKVDSDKTIEELLKDVQEQAEEGTSYHYCPLAEIQKEQELGNQLIKTIFVFENFAQPQSTQQQGNMPEILQSREETNYPISVNTALGNVLHVKIMYDGSFYNQEEMNELARRYIWTLEQMLSNQEKPVSKLKLITEREENLFYGDGAWNGEYKNETLVSLLEKQVAKHPSRTALVYGTDRISYEELLIKSSKLANWISKSKSPEEHYVILMAEHSLEMVISMYAIMRLGVAYVPVASNCPKERLRTIMEKCHTSLILKAVKEASADIPKEAKVCDVFESSLWEICELADDESTQDSPAYVIFTSGTTGEPKGVKVLQKHSVNFVYAGLENEFQHALVTECKSVYLTNQIIFDITLQEIFLPLSHGKTVIISKSELEEITPEQAENFREFSPVALIMTPTKLNTFLTMKSFAEVLPLTGVIMAGAEQFDFSVVSKIRKYSKAKIFNGYGPTETTCGVTYYEIQKGDQYAPIGKTIHGVNAYVLNGERLCGKGMTGELCIGGASVSDGYLGDEEQTDKVFVKNPYGIGKLYRTGDLARWNWNVLEE